MSVQQDQPFPFFRNATSPLSPLLTAIAILLVCILPVYAAELRLNDQDYLETQGLSVLLFHNAYHGVFGDEKMSGVESSCMASASPRMAMCVFRQHPSSGIQSRSSRIASALLPAVNSALLFPILIAGSAITSRWPLNRTASA